MAGAVLLGVVVAKLFLVELAQVGTITRIVSFIGVGLLLLLIGYLAPVPPRKEVTPMIRHLLLAAFVATAAHAEQATDYAAGVPLAPGSAQPFQKVEVPAAGVRGGGASAAGRLRVFNADGELVPFAWVPRPAATRERPPAVDLPPFPLFVDRERRDVAGLALSVVRNAAGTTSTPVDRAAPASRQDLGGYVLDASALARR